MRTRLKKFGVAASAWSLAAWGCFAAAHAPAAEPAPAWGAIEHAEFDPAGGPELGAPTALSVAPPASLASAPYGAAMPRMAIPPAPGVTADGEVQFLLTQPGSTQPLDLPALPSDLMAPSSDVLQSLLGSGIVAPPPFTPAGENISATPVLAAADTGDFLTTAANSVSSQRRAPLSFDPHIRGFYGGQVYSQAGGAFWLPMRPDLDSVFSKLDPGLIDNVNIINGPYGLRYGPGFGYFDVVMVNTPRYYDGYESHNRFGLSVRANGGQIFGRDTLYGGNSDYGYIINYSIRTGNDYLAGDDTEIPSQYNSQSFVGQIGFDLSVDSYVEVRYQRIDQTDTDYPGQIFDLGYLGTDAVTVNYVNEDFGAASRFSADLWFNYSRGAGDTQRPGKRLPKFSVVDRIEAALANTDPAVTDVGLLGRTDANMTNAGGRGVITFGDEGFSRLHLGADARYVQQYIGEHYTLTPAQAPSIPDNFDPIFTNLPRSEYVNPGLFAELEMPLSEFWTTTIGGRVDGVFHDARVNSPYGLRVTANEDTNVNDPNFGDTTGAPFGSFGSSIRQGADDLNLDRDRMLHAFFVASDVQLTDIWATRLGFGYAERAPTLIENYADGVFLGMFQTGYSRILGNPDLSKERLWQIDMTLSCEYDNFRGRASGYHAWVLDYISYTINPVSSPEGARIYRAANYDRATMIGFELYGEYDLGPQLMLFGRASYVEGRNEQIDGPLPSMWPLEGTAGFRLVDYYGGQTWGIEFGARMVNGQHRLGQMFRTGTTIVETVEVETAGFTTAYIRGYYNYSDGLTFVAGIDNMFDRRYLEHLDLRIPADPGLGFGESLVLAPGITPYFGFEWTY